jgi:hypothetical protein
MEQILASTPDKSEEAFIREVDEELRRDQLGQLWRRWGRTAIVVVVLALVALAGVFYFQNLNQRAADKQGEQYDAALKALGGNDAKTAIPALDTLSQSGGIGYRAMARFAEADALVAKQDTKGAVAKLSAISGDTALPQPFRDRAVVQQTSIEFDAIKPEVVISRLKGLAVPASPWFGTAGEMVAAAYLKQGRRDLAGKMFGQLAQSTGFVPDSIRQRAVKMAGVLGVDAIDQSEGNKAK